MNSLGHAHPRIVKVIREQSAKVIHLSNLYYNEYQGATRREALPEIRARPRLFHQQRNRGDRGRPQAGSRRRTRHRRAEKTTVIALENSFHGRTMGALALTAQPKYRQGFDPMLEGVRFVPRNDVDALACRDGRHAFAASCWSRYRVRAASHGSSPEFLQACRQLADQHHAALVFDEIQCGMGRTGQLFAFEHFGVVPDVVCIAKPMAAGFPMGAFLSKDWLAQHITPGRHGTTFGGGPLACRIALGIPGDRRRRESAGAGAASRRLPHDRSCRNWSRSSPSRPKCAESA